MSVFKIFFYETCEKDMCLSNIDSVVVDQDIIVNTLRGKRLARVIDIVDDVNVDLINNTFDRIVKNEDRKIIKKNKLMSNDALLVAKKYARSLNLNIGFVSAEYTFDRKQLFFLFVSDSRIDFRELAKRLAQKYKTRIELKQIGVRDKTSIIGGLGPCGLFLCCNTFLTELNSVSINMAKNQLLALNPNKINGICGRLLCCLKYEDEYYRDSRKILPQVGQNINFDGQTTTVISNNLLNRTYTVQNSLGDLIDVKLVECDEEKL